MVGAVFNRDLLGKADPRVLPPPADPRKVVWSTDHVFSVIRYSQFAVKIFVVSHERDLRLKESRADRKRN